MEMSKCKIVRGFAKLKRNNFVPANKWLLFSVENENEYLSVIATNKTNCDTVLFGDDEFVFTIQEYDGKNFVTHIKEVFDPQKILFEVLNSSALSEDENSNPADIALKYIDKKIFCLEVSEKFEKQEFLLIYDEIEGKIGISEDSDKLWIQTKERTYPCIIDTNLTLDKENLKHLSRATMFCGVHTTNGFYLHSCA